jgi:hypothetical protein
VVNIASALGRQARVRLEDAAWVGRFRCGTLPRLQLFGEGFELRGKGIVLALELGIGKPLGRKLF